MDCRKVALKIEEYLDGDVDETTRLAIQSHLNSCPVCFGRFEFEESLRQTVRNVVHREPPEKLRARIRSSINGGE
ncbi:MAG TPA: zf-HC2 domain-containing protein [bacterium]|nr:zf-HC2 domain-containing protein [bacterium]